VTHSGAMPSAGGDSVSEANQLLTADCRTTLEPATEVVFLISLSFYSNVVGGRHFI